MCFLRRSKDTRESRPVGVRDERGNADSVLKRGPHTHTPTTDHVSDERALARLQHRFRSSSFVLPILGPVVSKARESHVARVQSCPLSPRRSCATGGTESSPRNRSVARESTNLASRSTTAALADARKNLRRTGISRSERASWRRSRKPDLISGETIRVRRGALRAQDGLGLGCRARTLS